ncbi:MAG: cytochrome c biogenesis protein CcdA [Armatimonadota bacterium]|nr:cytochrome c biogenesis protein CcdA [Armatimonadota bacterium]
MPEVGLIVAFGAGVLGFLSPCILPLVPGYVAFVSGVSVAELQGGGRAPLARVLVGSLLFVVGFSVVFTSLGASASLLGTLVLEYRSALTRAGGAVVIAMGLVLLGVLRIPALYRERRIPFTQNRWGIWGALPLGMAFGFAWTPCVGPTLAAILTLATTAGTVQDGARLLFVYSLGLGLPFLVTAAVLSSAVGALRWVTRHGRAIETAGGLLLLVMGGAMVTDSLFALNAWLFRIIPFRPAL